MVKKTALIDRPPKEVRLNIGGELPVYPGSRSPGSKGLRPTQFFEYFNYSGKIEPKKSDISFGSSTSSSSRRFEKQVNRIPCKSLLLAMFLMSLGGVLIIIGSLSVTGNLTPKIKVWPLFLFGTLIFIPGFYHIRIAFFALMGRPGYTFDQIRVFG